MLVNNAGGLGDFQAAAASPLAVAVFDDMYQLNVRPAIVASNAAIEALLASKVLACLKSRTQITTSNPEPQPPIWP